MTAQEITTNYVQVPLDVDWMEFESPSAQDGRRADLREQLGDFLTGLNYEFADAEDVREFLAWVSSADLTAAELSRICGYNEMEPMGHDWQPYGIDGVRCVECAVIDGRIVEDATAWPDCQADVVGTPMKHRWVAFANPDYHFGHCLNCGTQGPKPIKFGPRT